VVNFERISEEIEMPKKMLKRMQVFVPTAPILFGVLAFGQTGASPAAVTLGVPPPVAGQQFTVYALVTNLSRSPAPTGSIQFDFGDGTSALSVPMTYRVAIATHTYFKVGSAQITATYSGDSNFAPASAVVQGQILTAVPAVTLNVFGDSISAAGDSVSADGTNWITMVAYVHGWQLNNSATPGYRTPDGCQYIYGTAITPATYSAVFLGPNDVDPWIAQAETQYQNTLLACTAWLLIPVTSVAGTHPKFIAQDASVSQGGVWTPSSLFPSMGLTSTEAGDSLTATVTGSSVYIGLSGTTQSNYTVDVLVDGQLAGEYTPAIFYSGDYTNNVPYGIRIPVPGSGLSSTHTVSVVCANPGTSGCNVDWFGGNGFATPNREPWLWLGEFYETASPTTTYAETLSYVEGIRKVGEDFQADGLGVTLVDVFDNFDSAIDTPCMGDGVHPALCGHQILAATFLGAMDWLFTKDQRIDFGQPSSIAYGSGGASVEVNATSGLPVSLNVTSGPATLNGTVITPTAVGSVVLEADQSGDANYLPAASATEIINITPAPVSVSLTPSAVEVPYQGTFSATVKVVWRGAGPVSGNVELLDGNTAIGTAALDSTGAATFSNLQLAPGNHGLTASFAQQGNFAAGYSPAVDVVVDFPPPSLQITASSPGVSLAGGQQVSFSLHLVPSLGFTPSVTFGCAGLPALASCQFSQNPLALGVSGATETVTIVTTGPFSDLPPVQAKNRTERHAGGFVIALAAAFRIPGLLSGLLALLRGRHGRDKHKRFRGTTPCLAAMAFTWTLLNGCGGELAPRTPVGTYTVTVTAAAVQGATTVTQAKSFQLNVAK
jgi:hypothetical protein